MAANSAPMPAYAPCRLDRRRASRYGRAHSRLTVLVGSRNTVAIVGNKWQWASPRLKVSRSSALKCE